MKLVAVSNLFDVFYGSNLELNALEICNCKQRPCVKHNTPFVSRTVQNNGVSAYVAYMDTVKLNPAHTLSVAGGGSVMTTFYQDSAYYSGRDLYYLIPKIQLNKKQMLYYAMCLTKNAYRYSYGRQANKTLKNILIPTLESIPKWVDNTKIFIPQKKPVLNKTLHLNIEQWKQFNVDILFDVKGTKSYTKQRITYFEKGKYPYITTSSVNNAVEGFYNHFTETGNVLTVDSATVGSCFYQGLHFTASDHVEKLVPKFEMNIYTALFLQTIMNCERFRYGYGRKFAQKRMKNTRIRLPATPQGDPDWRFMEEYIKSLPYSRSL